MQRFTRRRFLTQAALAAAALRLPAASAAEFVDPLPVLPERTGGRIVMAELHHQLHRDLPPTRLWAYDGAFPGPTIVAHCDVPTHIEWVNHLPAQHFLPVDTSLPGAGPDLPPVRAVTHVHGARVPHTSDGYPEDWFVPGQSRHALYPNRQPATMLFYHDHAMGLNRLNVYAGLFGLYILRDRPAPEFEIPMVFCDRLLDCNAQLYYPVSGDPLRPWVPEVFGDRVVVNGKLTPFVQVEPRPYSLRWLNASNGRFFNFAFSNRLNFQVTASDQGALAAPVTLGNLQLAPAERFDIQVDFRPHAGTRVYLCDGPNRLVEFRVAAKSAPRSSPAPRFTTIEKLDPAAAIRTRRLTLAEDDDAVERPMVMLLDGKHWRDPVSETPRLGTTEIWEFVNLTDDSHPIHLHLVRFQILDRRPFELVNEVVQESAPPRPPAPEERGWKDTVRCPPGAITRIIVRFEGYAGRYLWHCHLLEHEANDMMRPYDLLPT
ncbi:MAG TPA: multicopper oxidase domain-containing protein [Terriglobales bacterium]|nr:multicopper oxidase domain-containing protein [Terriglobales bacterium]